MAKNKKRKGAAQPQAVSHATGRQHEPHRGRQVQVGPYYLYLGGTQYLQAEDLAQVDILLPLTETELEFGSWYTFQPVQGEESFPGGPKQMEIGHEYCILAAPLKDFGGVPEGWEKFLKEQLIPLLAQGCRVLAFCIGSHGRTGTLLACLISLLEPEVADPIAEARRRHCQHAVETRPQAEAVFALRGQPLPETYQSLRPAWTAPVARAVTVAATPEATTEHEN